MDQAERDWVDSAEALARLGVRPQTLYAYVSRGRIAARPDPDDPRRSLYSAHDLERFRARSPMVRAAIGPAPARGEALVRSAVTAVIDGRPYYRGQDATVLSAEATLETAARILWDTGAANPFVGMKPRIDTAYRGMARTRLLQHIARRADEDEPLSARPDRDLGPEAASILDGLVDAVVGPGPRLWLHQRLARAWKIADADAHVLRRALVLAADHDLNAATLATRAVAGTGASPAAAVMAGLAALIGPDGNRRLSQAAAFVAETQRDPPGTVRRRVERGEALPGFGHPLYPDGDPRAEALLAAARLPRELQALVEAGEAATGLKPSFGLALALVVRRFNLPREAAFDLFVIGRSAGLLAHAIDQAHQGSPIRARLRYVGVAPVAAESG